MTDWKQVVENLRTIKVSVGTDEYYEQAVLARFGSECKTADAQWLKRECTAAFEAGRQSVLGKRERLPTARKPESTMSRSRDRSHCPHGKRNCGVGCSREDLNEVKLARQAPAAEPYTPPGACCCCADEPGPTAQDLEYERREREYEVWIEEQELDARSEIR